MFAVGNTGPAHVFIPRRRNTWYSVKDGFWSDPTTWMSNNLSRSSTQPLVDDVVVINHNVVLDNSTTYAKINSLYVNVGATLSSDNNGRQLMIYDKMIVDGTLNFTGASPSIYLYGYTYRVANFYAGLSTIYYYAAGPQSIMSLNYWNMNVESSGVNVEKTLEGDISIYGSAYGGGNGLIIETGPYNVTTYGNVTVGFKTASNLGTFKFKAGINLGGGRRGVELTGGPYVELTGNFITGGFNFGQGTTRAVGNTTISGSTTMGDLIIDPGVTLINNSNLTFNSATGVDATSTLRNQSQLNIINTTPIMPIGIFDYMPSGFPNSVMNYAFAGDYVLPYTTYQNLALGGANGIKSPPGDITVLQDLTSGIMSFDFGPYNGIIYRNLYAVTGQAIIKTGPGSILVHGLMKGTTGGWFNFSVGNPDIEMRGGWDLSNATIGSLGSGNIVFTTNNQTLSCSANDVLAAGTHIKIADGIEVTMTGLSGSGAFTLNEGSSIDGLGATSKFTMNRIFILNSAVPVVMATGIRDLSGAAFGHVKYNRTGDQDVLAGNYRLLTMQGSGVKRLLGNINVSSTYTISAPATVNLNGYTKTP